MATDEKWVKFCNVWASSDGSIYSATFTAPAPSKNFLQIYINSSQVILRIWKILPPTRADSNQAPVQLGCNYAEFADEERMRGEIERNMGKIELEYIDRVVGRKHLDCLNRLPRKVLLRIAFYLDLVSIAKLGQVNKLFRELCSCDALWSKIYMDHSKKQVSQELLMLVDQKGWKEVFFMNKLQLQMQMRRTAKESRFHYGNKFLGGVSKSGFFLTSNQQHSWEDEGDSNRSSPMKYLEQRYEPNSQMGKLKLDEGNSSGRQSGNNGLREYDDNRDQSRELTPDAGSDQYRDDAPHHSEDGYDTDDSQEDCDWGYQYQDVDSGKHPTIHGDMNTPEPVSYQE